MDEIFFDLPHQSLSGPLIRNNIFISETDCQTIPQPAFARLGKILNNIVC
jgi:hypothetical protein